MRPLLWLALVRSLSMALSALFASRLRSIFVVLTVALGIAALTLIVMAVDGANCMAYQIMDTFGPNVALILGGNIKKQGLLPWASVPDSYSG